MFKKSILLTAACISSMSLSGCSSIWSGVSVFADDMAELTSFAWLRGSSTESDINFAETVEPETGVYKTAVGEYVPTTVETPAVIETNDVTFGDVELYDQDLNDFASTVVDTSPVPCPDGTYLTADNTCAFLENETFDFADITTDAVSLPVDTSPVPCPDDTYLAEDNTCMFFDNEATDFARDLAADDVVVVVDTSPHPCPENTYLTADNTCMSQEIDIPDFADNAPADIAPVVNTLTQNTPSDFSVAPSTDTVSIPLTECPKGFKLDGKSGCRYLGASLQTKF